MEKRNKSNEVGSGAQRESALTAIFSYFTWAIWPLETQQREKKCINKILPDKMLDIKMYCLLNE